MELPKQTNKRQTEIGNTVNQRIGQVRLHSRYLGEQAMEFIGGDEHATAALEQAGERAAHRVHEAAPRLHVRRQDAARPEQEAQSMAHFRVFRVSVLRIDAGTKI